MVKAKMKVYPYVTMGEDGKYTGMVFPDGFRSNASAEVGGSISDFSNEIYVHLPAIEIEVEIPDNINELALKVLRHHRNKLRAEHQKTLTKLQFMENQLLRLEYFDVLDADPGQRNDARDIPF